MSDSTPIHRAMLKSAAPSVTYRSQQHQRWLRAQRFADPAMMLTYDTAFDTMLATVDRRDRLASIGIAQLRC